MSWHAASVRSAGPTSTSSRTRRGKRASATCARADWSPGDDNPEALAVRLAAYHGETRPVIDIFQRKEYVITVDGAQGISEIQKAIRAQLPGIR